MRFVLAAILIVVAVRDAAVVGTARDVFADYQDGPYRPIVFREGKRNPGRESAVIYGSINSHRGQGTNTTPEPIGRQSTSPTMSWSS